MAFAAISWRPYHRQLRNDAQRQNQTLLYHAIAERNQSKMLSAIKKGACWKILNPDGDTVLHIALKEPCNEPDDQMKAIKILEWFLKQKKLHVDAKNKAGSTALHLAVKNEMIEVVDYLIGKGASLNVRDECGNWIAHYLVEGEFNRYVKLTGKATVMADELRPFYRESVHFFNRMLMKKIKVDCANNNLDTPLHIAARRNLLHVMPILLQYTKDVTFRDEEKKTVLHLFIENKTRTGTLAMKISCYDRPLVIDILKMMLKKGYNVNATDLRGNTPLHHAAYQDDPELIEIMLKKFKKVNICNQDGNTLLHIIIDNCIDSRSNQHKAEYVRFVRILLYKHTDIELENVEGYKPLHLAVMRVHPTILQILKDHGAYFKQPYNGGNLLHLLSQKSSETISSSKIECVIGLLVSQGCRINARDKDGMTPMHLAAQSRRNVIPGLTKYHANVDARELSINRLTPLQLAVHTDNGYSINTLVNVGADINAKDSSGKTPLHLAMKYKTACIAKILLKFGAHADVEDDEELLPLHYAIRNQNGLALAELLKFGADIHDIDTYRELICLKDPGLMLFGVLEHWIKMKAAGLPVAPGYRTHAAVNTYQELYQDCLKEIESLKAYQIGDHTSLYDLLHMDWNSRCAYTVNKSFKELIKSTVLQTKFPKYHVLILACYYEAVARQPLLEPAKRAWYEFTKIILPDVCVYRIMSHLKNRDLNVMVEGLKDRSFRKPCNLLLNVKERDFDALTAT